MVRLVILLLTGLFIEFSCSRYQCSSERVIFCLEIYGKLTGLSNQFEPSIVFDPSEFEGPRFDSMHNVTHNALNQTNISKSIVT